MGFNEIMNNNFITISEVTIYKNKLDLDICQKSASFIKSLQDKFIDKSWDCDIKTSKNLTNNILNIIELRDLKYNILAHIDNYMQQRGLFYDGYIRDSWVNIYEKKFYQEFHTHINEWHRTISGVIYLTAKNSDIVFDVTYAKRFTPEFSEIILFEDDLPHRVVSNEEDLRISLAFNFAKCARWSGIKE